MTRSTTKQILTKTSSLAALALAVFAGFGASAARADEGYQPYYAVNRDAIQYSNITPDVQNATISPETMAQPTEEELPATRFYHFDNELWAAAGTSFFNYKENSSPVGNSEHGWLPSLAGGGSYMTHGNLYLSFDGSISLGNAHDSASYDAATGKFNALTGSSAHQTISTIDAKIGQGLQVSQSVMFIPYIDGGFRYWTRDLGQGQSEDYHNFDVLGGVMMQYAPTDRLMLSVYGSGGTTVGGRMTATNNETYDLGATGMEKAGAKLGYDLTRDVELFTTFDYDHFHSGASPLNYDAATGTTTSAPGSMTSDATTRVGIGYHFR
ncbi:MAG: hypothetical protein KGI37_04165 [Alphaproteobacteria bacterium]|nr:hypothetical protein [Alphaproteobacteria bacterium]